MSGGAADQAPAAGGERGRSLAALLGSARHCGALRHSLSSNFAPALRFQLHVCFLLRVYGAATLRVPGMVA